MHSLTFKLTLAFLAVSLTGILLVALLIWGIASSEFNRFVTARGLNDYATAATNYYKANGSWDGVAEALQKQELVAQGSTGGAFPLSPSATRIPVYGDNRTGESWPNPFLNPDEKWDVPPSLSFILVDPDSRVIIPFGPFHQGTELPADIFRQREAITVDRVVVGYVVVTGRSPNPKPIEARFLARMNQALVFAAIGASTIAVLLGLLLTRTITRPVRDLTLAARALSSGRLNQQVPVRSRDEIGELTKTFNTMSAELALANRLRKQMTADIAHDLRTPLAVITGYLEGLKDGVLKPTRQRFAAMHDEALYLQRLVDDLRLLSLADAGELSINCQPVNPGEMITRLQAAFQHQAEQKEIHLIATIEEGLPTIQIDPERMLQALSNLVTNALRYTPAGGTVTLSARQAEQGVWIEVQDTGAGIDSETLPHVFERFYRGDNARQDDGTGLGLAITKSIVELQKGKISVASQGPGKGSSFRIEVPA